MDHDELLNIDEAAELLQIHAVTIQKWIERGLRTEPGDETDEIRIRRSDLEAFLEQENQGHTTEVGHEP